MFQQADALPHGRAVDAELLDQLGLGADRIAGSQAAGENLPLDGFGDHLIGRNRSEEHTSELQSLMRIPYAVFCMNKKNKNIKYACSQLHLQKQTTRPKVINKKT